MIPALYFGIGFVIYVGFCLFTFDIYSKKKEITKSFVLGMIYAYYSILAVYTINLVETNNSNVDVIIQALIYLIACALILVHHYNSVIKKKDDEMYENNF